MQAQGYMRGREYGRSLIQWQTWSDTFNDHHFSIVLKINLYNPENRDFFCHSFRGIAQPAGEWSAIACLSQPTACFYHPFSNQLSWGLLLPNGRVDELQWFVFFSLFQICETSRAEKIIYLTLMYEFPIEH